MRSPIQISRSSSPTQLDAITRSVALLLKSMRSAAEVALLSTAMSEAMPGRGGIEGAPFWSESPFFVNRLGVPAVYCAPGDIRNCHTFEEHVDVEEYLAGVVSYAAFIARYCGVVGSEPSHQ